MFGNPEAQSGPARAGKGSIESRLEPLQSRPSLKQARVGSACHKMIQVPERLLQAR